MYLSRLILNPRSRAARRDVADCHNLHRTVMSAFPQVSTTGDGGDARSRLGVLHRLDLHPRTGIPTLLVQSRVAPNWSAVDDGYLLDTGGDPVNPAARAIDEAYRSLDVGAELVFRLRANPTRRIDTAAGPDGRRPNGKRVDLRDEASRLTWLGRKAEHGGFWVRSARAHDGVPDVRTLPAANVTGRRPGAAIGPVSGGASRLTFGSVLFEGVLEVTDIETFRQTLEHGIGSGKAYGFGLLSVARPGAGMAR